MGASGWQYFVPWEKDVGRALATLRNEVFRQGKYWSPTKRKPATIEKLLEKCAESGTHSILDVNRITTEPHPPSLNTFFQSFVAEGHTPTAEEVAAYLTEVGRASGSVTALPEDLVRQACGTTKPTRAQLEEALPGWIGVSPRGTGLWTTAYDRDGKPTELLFFGFSGD